MSNKTTIEDLKENDRMCDMPDISKTYVPWCNSLDVASDPKQLAAIQERLQDPDTIVLLHGAMGIASEAGELIDAVKAHIMYGKPIDRINVREELGDNQWFVSLLAMWLGDKDLDNIHYANKAKLISRFGDKFDYSRYMDRDLDAEREAMRTLGDPDPYSADPRKAPLPEGFHNFNDYPARPYCLYCGEEANAQGRVVHRLKCPEHITGSDL